ncbi:MAG: DUF4349 domain-containing protein, partial [Patescibacteria group bacterium]
MLDNMPGIVKKGLIAIGILFLAWIAFAIFSYANRSAIVYRSTMSNGDLSINPGGSGYGEASVEDFSILKEKKGQAGGVASSPSLDVNQEISGPGAKSVSQNNVNAVDKKIIKTGNLSLTVAKADTAAEKIGQIAKENQGEVYSSDFYETTNGLKSGTITIRVPH